MKKAVLIVVASAGALTACTSMLTPTSPYGAKVRPSFAPLNPYVYVVENQAPCKERKRFVVVDQEPIYFFRGDGAKVPIVWRLQTPGFKFDKNAHISNPKPISGPADQVHSCGVRSEQVFTCINENNATGLWKYTLTVVADDICGNPPPLDPTIGND
jgi:hypothetical protein